ncbi:MAG: hypothetical protein JO061_16810 [Acidobacteriaceae bacterium]|nr:hypothetical protein [Acidobacteriaceae bacterium]
MKKSSQKVGIGSVADDPGARTSLDARIAARLQYLEDDPLDFWDYGMLCAFEIIEARIREMIEGGRERIRLSDVLKIVAAEQRIVESESLHSSYQVSEPTDVEQNRSRGTPSQNGRGVGPQGKPFVKATAAGEGRGCVTDR